jgi:hypothetical protein
MESPQGTAVDGKGNWYISNTYAENVPEYSPGGASRLRTLDDSGWFPDDVATRGNDVLVSNIYSSNYSGGNVCMYRGHSTKQSYCLNDVNAFEGSSVAFDKAGNCYWSYNDQGHRQQYGEIDEFPKCAKGANPVNLGMTFGFAGGIAFDDNDNLWYVDQYAGLYKCIGTLNCSLVKAEGGYWGSFGVIYFNFNREFSAIFCAGSWIDTLNPTDYAVATFAQIGPSDPPFGVATTQ